MQPLVAAPKKPKEGDSQTGPSCIDGLWEIIRQSEALITHTPQVLALAMQALATLWQVSMSVHAAEAVSHGC